MEVFWTVPIYFIFPLFGIIIIIIGIITLIKRRTGFKRIIIGIVLLSIPYFYDNMIEDNNTKVMNSIPGKYYLKSNSKEIVLSINEDNSFYLKAIDSLENGKGIWELHHWDIEQLDLKIENKKKLVFEVIQINGEIRLQYDPSSGKDITFIKK